MTGLSWMGLWNTILVFGLMILPPLPGMKQQQKTLRHLLSEISQLLSNLLWSLAVHSRNFKMSKIFTSLRYSKNLKGSKVS